MFYTHNLTEHAMYPSNLQQVQNEHNMDLKHGKVKIRGQRADKEKCKSIVGTGSI
jgi:hypothetical protein